MLLICPCKFGVFDAFHSVVPRKRLVVIEHKSARAVFIGSFAVCFFALAVVGDDGLDGVVKMYLN